MSSRQRELTRVKSRLIKTVHALKAILHQKKAADIIFKVIVFVRTQRTQIHEHICESYQTNASVRDLLILKQACSPEYQGAQCAFKDLMIH